MYHNKNGATECKPRAKLLELCHLVSAYHEQYLLAETTHMKSYFIDAVSQAIARYISTYPWSKTLKDKIELIYKQTNFQAPEFAYLRNHLAYLYLNEPASTDVEALPPTTETDPTFYFPSLYARQHEVIRFNRHANRELPATIIHYPSNYGSCFLLKGHKLVDTQFLSSVHAGYLLKPANGKTHVYRAQYSDARRPTHVIKSYNTLNYILRDLTFLLDPSISTSEEAENSVLYRYLSQNKRIIFASQIFQTFLNTFRDQGRIFNETLLLQWIIYAIKDHFQSADIPHENGDLPRIHPYIEQSVRDTASQCPSATKRIYQNEILFSSFRGLSDQVYSDMYPIDLRAKGTIPSDIYKYHVIMFYLPGTPFITALKRGEITGAQHFSALITLAEDLQRIHADRLVHLDIKEENAIWDGHRTTLIDYEHMKPLEKDMPFTKPHSFQGTEGYVDAHKVPDSPETPTLFRWSHYDDLFSLGVVTEHLYTSLQIQLSVQKGALPKLSNNPTRRDLVARLEEEFRLTFKFKYAKAIEDVSSILKNRIPVKRSTLRSYKSTLENAKKDFERVDTLRFRR